MAKCDSKAASSTIVQVDIVTESIARMRLCSPNFAVGLEDLNVTSKKDALHAREHRKEIPLSQGERYARIALLLSVACNIVVVFLVIPILNSRLSHAYNHDKFTDGYDLIASNLVAGNGYRFYPDTAQTMMREPGYPLLLAGLYLVFGKSFVIVKSANLAFALMTAWLLRLLTQRVVQCNTISATICADLASSLFFLHPGIMIAESRGGVELLFAMLTTGLILVLIDACTRNSPLRFAAAGAILGLIVIVRSTPVLFPILFFAGLLLLQRKPRPLHATLKQFLAFTLAMTCVMSPWIVRNFKLTHRFVPTASVLGVSAQAGEYINSRLWTGKPFWLLDREASRERDKIADQLGYRFEDGANGYYQTFYRAQDELTFSAYLMHSVTTIYRKSPLLFARCIAQNAFNFWFSGRTWDATLANIIVQMPYLAFAIVGIVSLIKQERLRVILPILVYMGGIFAVHLPVLAQARYSIPFVPLLATLSIAGVAEIWKSSIGGIGAPKTRVLARVDSCEGTPKAS